MILRIDVKSSVPVYRQIVDATRILLVNGELNPGDALPPVRRLALDLGVHFNTVAEAYRTLAGEGWLEIAGRSGVRVISRGVSDHNDSKAGETFQRRLREMAAEAQAHGFSRKRIARELRRLAGTLERS